METKKCKHCKEEIDKKAKKCPKCGGNQGMSGFLKVLIVIAIIIVCVVGCVASCTKGVGDAVKEAVDETEKAYADKNNRTEFKLNEIFENSYLKVTLSEVNDNFKNHNEYISPKKGYKYVSAKFDVENIGEEDQYISYLEFNGYADNTAVEQFYSPDDEYEILSATISKGKKAVGYVILEVPKDAKEITLEYKPGWILDNQNIKFILK